MWWSAGGGVTRAGAVGVVLTVLFVLESFMFFMCEAPLCGPVLCVTECGAQDGSRDVRLLS